MRAAWTPLSVRELRVRDTRCGCRFSSVAWCMQPAAPSVFSSLPGPFSALAPENEELLKEVQAMKAAVSSTLGVRRLS